MKLEIQSQDHTEVYASDQGYCCIRQHNGLEEPVVVLITPSHVDELCRMLQLAKNQATENRCHYLESGEVQ